MKKFLSTLAIFLLALNHSNLMANNIQTTDIIQFGHSDGYSKSGKFVGTNWHKANLKIEDKKLFILFGTQDSGEISYFQIFSYSNSSSQTEQNIVDVKELFKQNNISYDDVKSQAIFQIKKTLKI